MFVLKNCNDPGLLASFPFTDEKIFTLYSDHIENTHRMTDCIRTFINQEERRRDKTPAHN